MSYQVNCPVAQFYPWFYFFILFCTAIHRNKGKPQSLFLLIIQPAYMTVITHNYAIPQTINVTNLRDITKQ